MKKNIANFSRRNSKQSRKNQAKVDHNNEVSLGTMKCGGKTGLDYSSLEFDKRHL